MVGQHRYIYNAVISYYNDNKLDATIVGSLDNKGKFKHVIDLHKGDHKYTQKGIYDLLTGLWLDVAFSNHDIGKLLEKWGVKPTDKNIERYWDVLAIRLLKLYSYLDNDDKFQKCLALK